MELEVTWGRVVRVWWAYLWRNLVAIFAVVVLAALLGFLVGAVFGSSKTSHNIATVLGGVMGLAGSIVPIKLILGKDFGGFRLVLLSKERRQGNT